MVEHARHILHTAGVPTADVLIEIIRQLNIPAILTDRSRVPVADGLVKGICPSKHIGHVRDFTGIPAADVSVEFGTFSNILVMLVTLLVFH